MNKSQALNHFWNGFGIPAYDENSVPKDASYPYITYSESLDSLGNVVPLTASIWDYSTSWVFLSEKQDQVARKVGGYGHYTIRLDEGYLYLTKGTPFAQRIANPGSDVKRVYINISGEFLTAY